MALCLVRLARRGAAHRGFDDLHDALQQAMHRGCREPAQHRQGRLAEAAHAGRVEQLRRQHLDQDQPGHDAQDQLRGVGGVVLGIISTLGDVAMHLEQRRKRGPQPGAEQQEQHVEQQCAARRGQDAGAHVFHRHLRRQAGQHHRQQAAHRGAGQCAHQRHRSQAGQRMRAAAFVVEQRDALRRRGHDGTGQILVQLRELLHGRARPELRLQRSRRCSGRFVIAAEQHGPAGRHRDAEPQRMAGHGLAFASQLAIER
ncbi:hypothetical protein CBM2585_A140031 [Cupriavidus taiwanensis]|nr:hypothetical protein CBM2585_A140031 [Cupriavidus taiwanensis]